MNIQMKAEYPYKTVTIKEVINPKDIKIIKLTETTDIFQSGKTFWDWVGGRYKVSKKSR